jgi:hypothetical protein
MFLHNFILLAFLIFFIIFPSFFSGFLVLDVLSGGGSRGLAGCVLALAVRFGFDITPFNAPMVLPSRCSRALRAPFVRRCFSAPPTRLYFSFNLRIEYLELFE